jgi:RPA family protein
MEKSRQIAKKVRLSDLANGKYVKVEGDWEPNYIEIGDLKVSRANVIAVVATEPTPELNMSTFTIDDGTARLPVRIFGETSVDVKLGDVINIIGRPREFGQQVYIVPEIVKKIDDSRWVEYRRMELGETRPVPEVPAQAAVEHPEEAFEDPVVEEIVSSPVDTIIAKIRELDQGNGADIEEVIATCGVQNAEQMIGSLMREGEIFEISSGRIKVLD